MVQLRSLISLVDGTFAVLTAVTNFLECEDVEVGRYVPEFGGVLCLSCQRRRSLKRDIPSSSTTTVPV